jgi:heptosyltransferase I
VLDGFLAFAKELGIKDLTPDWQLPISAEHQAWAKKVGGKPTLLICAAASKAFKN